MQPTVAQMFPPKPSVSGPELLNHRDLAARGWSRGMVSSFLPACDVTLPNPHHRNGSPMQMYALPRVLQAEKHPEFIARMNRAARRSVALRPSIELRREILLETVSHIELNVPFFTDHDLIRRSCRQHNLYWESLDRWDRRVTPSDPQLVLDRVCVNFLFYECASYRETVSVFLGKVGAADARLFAARRVLEEIATVYPRLSAECDRQHFRRVQDTKMVDNRIVLGVSGSKAPEPQQRIPAVECPAPASGGVSKSCDSSVSRRDAVTKYTPIHHL